MKHLLLPFLLMLISRQPLWAQDNAQNIVLGLHTGMINYEGDLKPNSFTFSHSHPYFSFFAGIPFSERISWRIGLGFGKLEGADRNNREYLKPRNLDFYTSIQEFYTGVEIAALDLSKHRLTPYLFLGGALFHFDPYTFDTDHNKVYLKPLSTEGQGLDSYPDRKPYKRTQLALAWAAGLRYRVNDGFFARLEFNQRKTFTDYLDDVSTNYVDANRLFQARGQRAVDLAYRGDELPNGAPYPHEGEQRGTPSEQDWYYMLGVTVEIKLHTLKTGLRRTLHGKNEKYYLKCPSGF